MSLEKRMNDLIMKYKVRPDALLDQSFMIDERMIKRIVSKACIKPGETVLEIGAGIGFLSIELVRTGGKVTSVELDERLRPILKEELKGTGIKIVCGNALEYIKGKGFDKIVSNTPYSICEPLVQRLTKTKFKEAFLSVPKRFAYRLLEKNGIGYLAQAFFKIEILFDIPKKFFKPIPKVNTAFIKLEPRSNDYYKKHLDDFVLRELVLQSTKKLKNALMEAIINREKLRGKDMTKKESKETIKKLKLNKLILEQKIEHINLKALVDINKQIKIDK